VLVADVRHRTCAKATNATSAKTSSATAAKATHVGSAKAAAHVAAAHAAAESTTAVSSSTATAAAGFCTRGEKAAGKHCACQNHHHSSSHDILLCDGRTFPPSVVARCRRLKKANADVAMNWRWGC
jgi:hypothetical protein